MLPRFCIPGASELGPGPSAPAPDHDDIREEGFPTRFGFQLRLGGGVPGGLPPPTLLLPYGLIGGRARRVRPPRAASAVDWGRLP